MSETDFASYADDSIDDAIKSPKGNSIKMFFRQPNESKS